MKDVPRKAFLLEYRGTIQDCKAGEKLLESHYKDNLGCFVYFFKFGNKSFR
jgi:hypothetical protein